MTELIRIECRSVRKVEVPGLGDFYFKQVREFPKDLVESSDVQRFLSNGSLRIVAGSVTTWHREEPLPVTPKPTPIPEPEPVKETPEPVEPIKVPAPEPTKEPEKIIPEPVKEPAPEPVQKAILSEDSLESLSDKLANEVIRKVSSGLSIEGAGIVKKKEPYKTQTGEVYIPSIQVTDMTSNINLESRVVGTGGKVNQSLGQLKAMRGKNG
jgi:hypothetical protein